MAAVQASTVTEDEDERDELLDEAIAAFRQMLVVDPSQVRVCLELALAFCLKEEDSLARQHFGAVLAGGVPSEVAANVQVFLLRIRARYRWSYNAGFAIALDTNIGAGSEERIILIPDFGQELPAARQSRCGSRRDRRPDQGILARVYHRGHGLRAAVRPTEQESRAARRAGTRAFRAMRCIGQAVRRNLSARGRRPSGRAQAAARVARSTRAGACDARSTRVGARDANVKRMAWGPR